MPPAATTPRRRASQPQAVTKSAVASVTGTRKRKINPVLKSRVETFLSNANPQRTSPPPESSLKRRKTTNERSSPPKIQATATAPAPKSNPLPSYSKVQGISSQPQEVNHYPKEQDNEKRLRVFRKAPPRSYLEKLSRAQRQRMVVLDRRRADEEAFPCEEIDIVGSTGNVYKVTVGLEPKCTCPDYLKGNQCKHIVYALVTVLKAPAHLQYQLAFLSSELREIFAKAPKIPKDSDLASGMAGKRKPVEGECPICYMDFDEANHALVWCRSSCGNNMHKTCFDQWVASQRGSVVRCVYCRSPWQSEQGDLKNVAQQGVVGVDGYVNVAHLTGQSTVRDTSSYHHHWYNLRDTTDGFWRYQRFDLFSSPLALQEV